MIKIRSFEVELIEFVVLGAVFFAVLFAVFVFKSNAICETVQCDRYDISVPHKGSSSIFEHNNSSAHASKIIIVDDNRTLTKYEDDIVSYNTHYYSLLLPYSLPHYTEKFGPYESSRKLELAMKQLYNQITQIGLVNDPSFTKSFNNMVEIIEDISVYQKNINNCLVKIKEEPAYICSQKVINYLEQIDLESGRLPIILQRREQEVTYTLNNIDNPSAKEAVKIITVINDHILILAQVTQADYYQQLKSKGFVSNDTRKPVVLNIIQSIEKQINPSDKPAGQDS